MQQKLLRPARKSNNAEKHELKGEGSGSMATRSNHAVRVFGLMSLFDLYFFDSIRRFESLDGLLPRFASSVLFSERARLRHSLAHEHRLRQRTETKKGKHDDRCVSPRTFVVGKPLAILRGGRFPIYRSSAT